MVEQYSPELSVPDNSDIASSVSFNESGLYEGLESISQVAENEYAQKSEPLDLKNLGSELAKRESRINDLTNDRNRLKVLLKKAKTAIDSINSKYKTSQEREKIAEAKNL